MMKTIATALAAAVGLAGCAATYEPPKITPATFSAKIDKPKGEIFAAVKRVLVLDGYRILSSDEGAGVISTARRRMRMTEADTDCGTTLGLPYIRDKRTITNIGVGVVVSARGLIITVNIEGEYLKGQVTQGIALKCVSKGRIEQSLGDKIARHLR